MLVSFDVVQLFTKVPIEESLEVTGRMLENNYEELITTLPVESMRCLLNFCLTSTYFMWGDQRYKQKKGAAMGSPLSPVIANIIMEHFEEEVIRTAAVKPDTWLRYVDYTFVVWKGRMEDLQNFLQHLNTIRTSIKFTMEMEIDGQLPFLDVLVKKNGDKLSTTVFRKKMHTDQYINYGLNHHPMIKSGVIKCLKTRMDRICDRVPADGRKTSGGSIYENGYPKGVVLVAMKKKNNTQENEDTPEQGEGVREPTMRNNLCVIPCQGLHVCLICA